MKPQDFIGKATYFEYGTQIFGENEKGELQMILDVRGWGPFQKSTMPSNYLYHVL
jgi:hypothetical protein